MLAIVHEPNHYETCCIRVGTLSGLGKERIRLLGQSPSPEKAHYGG
jgi:hypothetical protein